MLPHPAKPLITIVVHSKASSFLPSSIISSVLTDGFLEDSTEHTDLTFTIFPVLIFNDYVFIVSTKGGLLFQYKQPDSLWQGDVSV